MLAASHEWGWNGESRITVESGSGEVSERLIGEGQEWSRDDMIGAAFNFPGERGRGIKA